MLIKKTSIIILIAHICVLLRLIVSTKNISEIENGFANDVIVFKGKESTVFKIAHINRFSDIENPSCPIRSLNA